MNFGNCCIRARKAHTSIRKFSKENLTVKVSGVIVDAHLISMKFRTEGRQPLKIFLMRLACASEVFFSPKADDRFEAVDTETLFEYRSLFCAALPLLIGIIVIGF